MSRVIAPLALLAASLLTLCLAVMAGPGRDVIDDQADD